MAFEIFSGIPGRVVSVQIDQEGLFEVVGPDPGRNVNLNFVQVHVSGGGITQAQRVTGVANGSRFEVILLNDRVRIQPVPSEEEGFSQTSFLSRIINKIKAFFRRFFS